MEPAEAGPEENVADLEWVSNLAASEPALSAELASVLAEIGRALSDQLERILTNPLAIGVRRLVQPVGRARDAGFIDGGHAVGEFGRPFDICARAAESQDVAPLVDACPDVGFVLHHRGSAETARGEGDQCREQLADLARRPNVACRLSASTTEACPCWHEDAARPDREHAVGAFGPMRCMFGGDWPVAGLTPGDTRWLAPVADALVGRSGAELEPGFAGTAERGCAPSTGSGFTIEKGV